MKKTFILTIVIIAVIIATVSIIFNWERIFYQINSYKIIQDNNLEDGYDNINLSTADTGGIIIRKSSKGCYIYLKDEEKKLYIKSIDKPSDNCGLPRKLDNFIIFSPLEYSKQNRSFETNDSLFAFNMNSNEFIILSDKEINGDANITLLSEEQNAILILTNTKVLMYKISNKELDLNFIKDIKISEKSIKRLEDESGKLIQLAPDKIYELHNFEFSESEINIEYKYSDYLYEVNINLDSQDVLFELMYQEKI